MERHSKKYSYIYLIEGGAFLVNIQSYGKFNLQEDCKRIAEENGFIMVDAHELKVNARPSINANDDLSANEAIMVFSKVGETLQIYSEGISDEW